MSGAGPVAVALAQAIGLMMSATFIIYVLIIAGGVHPAPLPAAGDARTLGWPLFVPALNEAKVIGHTVDYLRRTLPEAHVWVIDDASEDQTGAIVASRARWDPMVHVVSRRFPGARTGKGHALNAAYWQLRAWLPVAGRRDNLVIGRSHADGRPAPGLRLGRARRAGPVPATRRSAWSRSRCG